ncbi:AAA family ATPase [Gillisia marina]|uniref:AAA family ATPase n=1 Tax=Gillisia marina TaxID=1167637 RepID=UPI00029A0096|nr:ATP-binding protein [Gillisia marina]
MEEKLKQKSSTRIKVVLFGPESTGKTTMAKKLAAHFETEWVEEYMREYLQKKWDSKKEVCKPEDLITIAEGQIERENQKTKTANKILICDTDLLELSVYSKAYYNEFCEPAILKHALNNWYDLYFLTNIDVPWVADDLRDKPEDRVEMFTKFKNALQFYEKPFIELKGDENERFETAVSAINELLKSKN